MEKKILGIIILAVMSVSAVQLSSYGANTTAFAKYFDAAQTNYEQGQYSSAITNYRQALRINYLDNKEITVRIENKLDHAINVVNEGPGVLLAKDFPMEIAMRDSFSTCIEF